MYGVSMSGILAKAKTKKAKRKNKQQEIKTSILKVAGWNITATFFTQADSKNPKDPKHQMRQHFWENRKECLQQAVFQVRPDVIGLQEIAPDQAMDLFDMFPTYGLFFFTSAKTNEIDAGKIYTTSDEIKEKLLGKFIGTALTAIMYDKKNVQPCLHDETKEFIRGMFWYNPDPWTPPTVTDRAETDKGFGNMNTPRAVGFVKFQHLQSKKPFLFATSHAPISGGWKTRAQCFKLEVDILNKLSKEHSCPFFSVGDRNLFPEEGAQETYEALVPPKTGVCDWVSPEFTRHEGFESTWLGFMYEKEEFRPKISTDGKLGAKGRLDIGISNIQSKSSAHYHCIMRKDKLNEKEDGISEEEKRKEKATLESHQEKEKEKEKLKVHLLGKLEPKDEETRSFVSDHSMVVATFDLA